MKRSLIAVLLTMSAATVFAGNSQYNNEAGEQDFSAPIAQNGEYRNEAGQSELHQPQVG